VINPSGSSGWSGYFKGVKNRLVFLDAADGGLLGVYDSGTGKKVFEDVAYDASIWNVSTEKSTAFDHLWVGQVEDGTYLLRYLRAVDTDCDLYGERETCWLSVKKKFGLKNTPIPTCFWLCGDLRSVGVDDCVSSRGVSQAWIESGARGQER